MSTTGTTYAPYFFLSYARSDPLAGNPDESPNKLVKLFFSDLTEAVKGLASGDSEEVYGFYDQAIPLGSDRNQVTAKAISKAQVFVRLYSVPYLNNSWSGREITLFKKRVEQAGRSDPESRFRNVLWAPLAGVADPPGLRASLARDVSVPGYVDNGLWALLKLGRFPESYQIMVDRLATDIVELAEHDPIQPVEPSKVGDIEQAASEFPPDRRLPVFNVEVVAPTAASAPRDRDPRAYGETPSMWRPFPAQELPLAEHARQLIEPFDFDVRVGAVLGSAARRPGIIVIDPAFIASEAGRGRLSAIAAALPRWVLPLVVVAPDDGPTREFAAGVLDILTKAKALPPERSGQAARGVNSLDDFVSIVPVLVAEAERQYFRYRSSRAPRSRAALRPSLKQPEDPEGPATASHP